MVRNKSPASAQSPLPSLFFCQPIFSPLHRPNFRSPPLLPLLFLFSKPPAYSASFPTSPSFSAGLSLLIGPAWPICISLSSFHRPADPTCRSSPTSRLPHGRCFTCTARASLTSLHLPMPLSCLRRSDSPAPLQLLAHESRRPLISSPHQKRPLHHHCH